MVMLRRRAPSSRSRYELPVLWIPAVTSLAVAGNLSTFVLWQGGATGWLYEPGKTPRMVSITEQTAAGPTGLSVHVGPPPLAGNPAGTATVGVNVRSGPRARNQVPPPPDASVLDRNLAGMRTMPGVDGDPLWMPGAPMGTGILHRPGRAGVTVEFYGKKGGAPTNAPVFVNLKPAVGVPLGQPIPPYEPQWIHASYFDAPPSGLRFGKPWLQILTLNEPEWGTGWPVPGDGPVPTIPNPMTSARGTSLGSFVSSSGVPITISRVSRNAIPLGLTTTLAPGLSCSTESGAGTLLVCCQVATESTVYWHCTYFTWPVPADGNDTSGTGNMIAGVARNLDRARMGTADQRRIAQAIDSARRDRRLNPPMSPQGTLVADLGGDQDPGSLVADLGDVDTDPLAGCCFVEQTGSYLDEATGQTILTAGYIQCPGGEDQSALHGRGIPTVTVAFFDDDTGRTASIETGDATITLPACTSDEPPGDGGGGGEEIPCCVDESNMVLVCPGSPLHGAQVTQLFERHPSGLVTLSFVDPQDGVTKNARFPSCTPPVDRPGMCCYEVATGTLRCPGDALDGQQVSLVAMIPQPSGSVIAVVQLPGGAQATYPICDDHVPQCCFDTETMRLVCPGGSLDGALGAVVVSFEVNGAPWVWATWAGGGGRMPVCPGQKCPPQFCCINVETMRWVCPGDPASNGQVANVRDIAIEDGFTWGVLDGGQRVPLCGRDCPPPQLCPDCPGCPPGMWTSPDGSCVDVPKQPPCEPPGDEECPPHPSTPRAIAPVGGVPRFANISRAGLALPPGARRRNPAPSAPEPTGLNRTKTGLSTLPYPARQQILQLARAQVKPRRGGCNTVPVSWGGSVIYVRCCTAANGHVSCNILATDPFTGRRRIRLFKSNPAVPSFGSAQRRHTEMPQWKKDGHCCEECSLGQACAGPQGGCDCEGDDTATVRVMNPAGLRLRRRRGPL